MRQVGRIGYNGSMRTALLAVALLAAPASGETFTWSGGGGDPLFSSPLNWQGGVVPASGDDVTLVLAPFGRFDNDLAGLTVGTVLFDNAYGPALIAATADSLPIRVTAAVSVTNRFDGPVLADVPIEVAGDVAFNLRVGWGSHPVPSASSLGRVTGAADATVTVDGGVFLIAPQLAAGVRVPADSFLGVYAYDSTELITGGLTASIGPAAVDGLFDVHTILGVAGGGPLDLGGGTLRLHGIPWSLEQDTASAGRVEGDVRLGEWQVGGDPTYARPLVIDRLEVTGELDLTAAFITEGIGSGAGVDVLAPSDDPADVPPFLTLATYGSRVGTFANDALPVWVGFEGLDGHVNLFDADAPIVYTSGENDGPGEVRLLIPEPAAATLALAAAGLLLRRGRA